MEGWTIRKLNQINLDFYNKVGEHFDRTRNYNWEGWDQILEFLKSSRHEIKFVLDVGCGNGRFGGFLKDNLNTDFDYSGLDGNDYLLDVAKEKYKDFGFRFRKIDIVENIGMAPENANQNKDLIVVFGVMHHIPSFEKRVELLKTTYKVLDRHGVVIVSFWNFLEDERLKNKVVDWDEVNIDKNELEENDFLLSWDRGERALRYCHYFTDEELKRLIKESGFNLLHSFKAEGKNKNLNTYLILSR